MRIVGQINICIINTEVVNQSEREKRGKYKEHEIEG